MKKRDFVFADDVIDLIEMTKDYQIDHPEDKELPRLVFSELKKMGLSPID